ncbi:MAG: 2-oxoacid:acceptor oxidoreductase subunit alpha [Arcobacteraceae bacterium]|nr:2-oxoacid:acceptor oxidoreductase subunit alpha [Arcobacteraceae bacterium]
MTLNELKQYNGTNGTKAYIAYKGVVYDVTQSDFWQNGDHEGIHTAGEDLTEALAHAPHGEEVFKRFPVVGKLEENEASVNTKKELNNKKQSQNNNNQQKFQDKPKKDTPKSLKIQIKSLYKQYHLHSMTVHFPIALHLFAAVINVLFLLNPKESYEVIVFYSLFIATIMGGVAMVPGILSWWVNYDFSTAKAFVVKLIVSVITFILGVIAINIYYANPASIYEYSFDGIVYHFIVLITGVNVIILGYYGGKITWGNRTKRVADDSLEAVNIIKEKYEDSTLGSMENSISILIGGAAGTGINTLEKILIEALKKSGYYVFSTKEFMSRVRGGSNTALIRISNTPIYAPCWKVDISIAMDKLALEHMHNRWRKDTIVLADESLSNNGENITTLPIEESAKKFGNIQYANSYIMGVVFSLLQLDNKNLLESISTHFKTDDDNIKVAELAFKDGKKLQKLFSKKISSEDSETINKLHLMNGTTASGFGFLVGGCNMVTSYPMSPSTGVLNFMASMSKQFDIALEQSEDEIASLHMVLGGWYGGARAMTTTSGGGFALMGEALSLSGMTETPAVIYLAQRPGPATGLPTRSEQGDLNMAIYSGHGPFPRVVLAPGNLQECIEYGYLAFELADKYQIPVVFLSDQYLADSISMIEDIDFSSYEQKRYITKTSKEYQRYENTDDGISPRGIPDFGEGLICSVGDEHDQRGQITEDYAIREQMVAKRARKNDEILKNTIAPEIRGEGKIAIVGWGSTKEIIKEVLDSLDNDDLVQVHFAWVYPLAQEQLQVLKKYDFIVVVENNADGAFANQLKLHDIQVDKQILQSNGFNFFVDQLSEMIKDTLKEQL